MTGDHHQDEVTRVVSLPDSALAARQARRVVAELLADRAAPASQVDLAVLLTSEAVTNAVQHAARSGTTADPFRLEVTVAAGQVRVLVHDPDPTLPTPTQAGLDGERGRGLSIIASHAKEWGATRTLGEPGKYVWFVMPLLEALS